MWDRTKRKESSRDSLPDISTPNGVFAGVWLYRANSGPRAYCREPARRPGNGPISYQPRDTPVWQAPHQHPPCPRSERVEDLLDGSLPSTPPSLELRLAAFSKTVKWPCWSSRTGALGGFSYKQVPFLNMGCRVSSPPPPLVIAHLSLLCSALHCSVAYRLLCLCSCLSFASAHRSP